MLTPLQTETQGNLVLSIGHLAAIIGWPVLLGLAWSISRWLGKMETKFDMAVAKVTGNDLEHIQQSLIRMESHQESVASELRGLRDDIRSLK